jgi:hypothetical protein
MLKKGVQELEGITCDVGSSGLVGVGEILHSACGGIQNDGMWECALCRAASRQAGAPLYRGDLGLRPADKKSVAHDQIKPFEIRE